MGETLLTIPSPSPWQKKSDRQNRRMELKQEVARLHVMLDYEEKVNRILEAAFHRPIGSLPCIPSFLPPQMKGLLAELAMVEEEIARLEGEITKLHHNLNQEQQVSQENKVTKENNIHGASKSQQWQLGRLSCTLLPSSTPKTEGTDKKIASFGSTPETRAMFFINQAIKGNYALNGSHDNGVKENSRATVAKKKTENGAAFLDKISRMNVISPTIIAQKETHVGSEFLDKGSRKSAISPAKIPPKYQISKPMEHKTEGSYNSTEKPSHSPSSQEGGMKISKPNKISESIMKCLMCIFVRLIRTSRAAELEKTNTLSRSSLSCSSSRGFRPDSGLNSKAPAGSSLPREIDLQDPYGVLGMENSLPRDIGPYKNFVRFTSSSLDVNRISSSVSLLRKLRSLFDQLYSIDLRFLSYQQKLAFWINTYNACIMHAFLQYGIPSSPEKILELMNKAVLNIGGNIVNALAIEHFILRQPFDLKDVYWKGDKDDKEAAIRSVYGLEYPEPNVTFALSCGSRSSPAVRIYTGDGIFTELEKSKLEYLQASIGVTTTKKLMIPKLLHRYMLDFSSDLDSLVEWVCNQLPTSATLRKSMMECLRAQSNGVISEAIEVMPYDVEFQYLLAM